MLVFLFVSNPSHPLSVNVEFRKHDWCKSSDFLSLLHSFARQMNTTNIRH